MRIIGGEFKSRLIAMPKGVEIRPTQDKVREAIFNILGYINGKRVLELFAGSGAFGIEAISRGASQVTFVDNNFRCIDTIRANLESLSIDKKYYNIIKSNALSVVSKLEKDGERFDVVFIDPPYYMDLAKKSLISLDSCDILSPISYILVEHFKKDIVLSDFKTLIFDKDRRYGDTIVSTFKKSKHESQNSSLSRNV